MRTRFERRHGIAHGARQEPFYGVLKKSRAQLEFCDDTDAAPARRRGHRPRQAVLAERGIRRGNVDAPRAVEHGVRREFQTNGSESDDLFDIDGTRIAAANPRGDPSRQELGVALDIRDEIEDLVAAEGQRCAGFLDHGRRRGSQLPGGRVCATPVWQSMHVNPLVASVECESDAMGGCFAKAMAAGV